MDAALTQLESELDALTTRLLPPLRATKTLDPVGLAGLLSLGDRLTEAVSDADQVPRRLVGKAFFVFTTMLTEAEHADAPEPILVAAWEWQERLRRAFAPTF